MSEEFARYRSMLEDAQRRASALEAQLFQACALVRELERARQEWEGECPICLFMSEDGHDTDCRLAKVLSWGDD